VEQLNKRILIVEDELKIARFLQIELEHEKYQTAIETNGRRALDRITIKSEASHMQNSIEKLLFLARIDQCGELLKKAPVEMGELIEEVVQDTRLIAPEHQIILCQNDPVVLLADAFAIKQLLRIFIENSIKYTPAGGTISITSRTTGKHLEISVQDTGIGIPEEDQSRIFDRFYRVDKSRSKATGGTGLGLSIARWIAEQHCSTIHLSSTLGKGTTITVTIHPVCQSVISSEMREKGS
jgi:signal transduction histidine kinase